MESIQLIAKRTVEFEDQIINKITKTNLSVYCFLKEQYEKTDVSKNYVFQYVYCNFYTLDPQKVDTLFIKGYFELMQSLKGTKNADLETLLFKVYDLKTERNSKLHYSFTSKLAHTIDNNIPIWDSKIANVFSLKLTSVKDNGINGDNFVNVMDLLQSSYNKILTNNLIKSTLIKFNEKFSEFQISDTKKLDFIFWALGKI